MRRVVLLWNQSNTFGLSQDASLIEHALRQVKGESFEIVKADPLQPPSMADIVIHLEVPHPVWLAWAPVQVLMVNPEWFSPNWKNLLELFTQVWVKERKRVEEFGSKATWIPWGIRGPLKPVVETTVEVPALWVLGGSQNKHIAARALLPKWPEDCPVIVTSALDETELPVAEYSQVPEHLTAMPLNTNIQRYPKSVTIKRGFLEAKVLEELNQASPVHVCISAAEGFGYTAAQAESRGAGVLLNTLPVYEEYYADPEMTYFSFLQTPVAQTSADHLGFTANFDAVSTEDIRKAYKAVVPASEKAFRMADYRLKAFLGATGKCLVKALEIIKTTKKKALPPVLMPADCPPISVLTLVYNRRAFIDLAFLNLMTTDYPKNKIQWVIVDDSDDPNEMVLDKIKSFEERGLGLEVTYVPFKKKHTIGWKRNKAVEAAKHEICVNMDDDDVYPETSFRRRVAWLKRYPDVKVVGCTMMAMYDLLQGISAVNVPPWSLPQSQRVSEASFCFYRDYAIEHPFPDQQVAEGEAFVPTSSDKLEFLEIPPQQVLVALSHGKNTSSRKLAGRAQTGCFWGWAPEMIIWLHKLAGVEVEDTSKADKADKKKSKK